MYIPLALRRPPEAQALRSRDASDASVYDSGVLPRSSHLIHGGALEPRQVSISGEGAHSTNVIVGIVLGVVLGLFLIGVCAFIYVYRDSIKRIQRRKSRRGGRTRKPTSSKGSSKSSSKASSGGDSEEPPEDPPPPPPANDPPDEEKGEEGGDEGGEEGGGDEAEKKEEDG